MNDWGRSVLDQYDIKVESIRRGRGALLCETEQGLKILQPCGCTPKHLEAENRLLLQLREHGFSRVDVCVPNREGALCSVDAEHRTYVLRDWYDGTECSADRIYEGRKAVETLAELHTALLACEIPEEDRETVFAGESFCQEYARHNRELGRVRNFIRSRRQKGHFEGLIMASFSDMYEQARNAERLLEDCGYPQMYEAAVARGVISHGSFHYHNVWMCAEGCAVTNFQKACVQVQMMDLYHFMRKILEKQHWKEEVGYGMLNAYSARRSISKEQLQVLRALFAYPEKYWKQLNFYLNSKKAWIPDKNVEKLTQCIHQEEMRRAFIARVLE